MGRRPRGHADLAGDGRVVILIDSSAWIEYLRDTGSPVCERVDALLRSPEEAASTDVVRMELLAGARDGKHRRSIERLLDRVQHLPTRPLFDYSLAADIYATCRAAGVMPRSMTDCLVAAVAISSGASLLHMDADFDAIAAHTSLNLDSADQGA